MTRMWRPPSPSDDRGSIPLAMMIVVIGTFIGALIGTLVLTQITSTRVDLRRVHALHAAQAGLDVATGHIRSVATVTGSDRTKLPCGPLTGSLGDGSTAVYRVTVAYYLGDPQGQDQTWLNANKVRCNPGSGLGVVPAYAYLVSTGADQATTTFTGVPTRVINGTYTFKIKNVNVVGGLIRVKNGGGSDLCMDAPDKPLGKQLWLNVCTPNKVSQLFAYNQNLTISLVASRTGAQPLGLCLEYESLVTPPRPVLFQPCGSPTEQAQRWSFDDGSQFRATYANGSWNSSSLCLSAAVPKVASQVVVQTCGSGADTQRVFKQDSGVGAGSAGSATGQLINYQQFGRCLDITDFRTDREFLIAWPCKTTVNAGDLAWNQKFSLPAVKNGAFFGTSANTSDVGVIKSGPTNSNCMTSPGTTTIGSYVRFHLTCPAGTIPQNQRWTMYGKTDSYGTSYQIKDGFGLCLQPQDQNAVNPDFFDAANQVMKLYVGVCDGSTLQKWNAEPDDLNPVRLKDLSEK